VLSWYHYKNNEAERIYKEAVESVNSNNKSAIYISYAKYLDSIEARERAISLLAQPKQHSSSNNEITKLYKAFKSEKTKNPVAPDSSGATLTIGPSKSSKPIDITKHHFDVSVSFPGEVRDYVESVVTYLEAQIGTITCFYDNNFKAQLSRPSLDELLQDIYRKRSKLIVIFLCTKYQEKNWCGVEFKAIREILFERKNEKVMYIKMDDGEVSGVFKTDGFIDAREHTAEEIANYINERLLLLDTKG